MLDLLKKLLGLPRRDREGPASVVPRIHVPPPNLDEDENEGTHFWDNFDVKDVKRSYINTDHPVFHQGRYLYETQMLYRDAERWLEGHEDYQNSPITPDRVMRVATRYCQLINALGQLKVDYNVLREVIEGKGKANRENYYT